jgi:membrane-associated phospholipid phosphatase
MARRPALGRRARPDTTFEGLEQGALVAAGAAVYFLTRHYTEGSAEQATENGYAILAFEQRVGIAWESALQAVTLADHGLVTLFNWIYIWGHWPVIITALVSLHRVARDSYLQLRNAMVASGAIGIVIFAWYPVAPPRLLPDDGFVDTVSTWSYSYRVLQPPTFVNQYAAMPSLHVGWNLLVGVIVWRATTRWVLRCLSVASPLLMACAVVATANHYVLDVLAGALVALLGYAIALHVGRLRTTTTGREPQPMTAALPREGPASGAGSPGRTGARIPQ